MSKYTESFEKEVEALTNGNPSKPHGDIELSLARYWYEQGKLARDNDLKSQNKVLKSLLLLTHPSVSNITMNDVAIKQWQAFLNEFPKERGEVE